MKYIAVLFVVILFSCQNADDRSEDVLNINAQTDSTIEINSNHEVSNNFMEVEVSNGDSISESQPTSYTPFSGVNRKPAGQRLILNTYDWKGFFSYSFPEEHQFEKFEKDDHDSYAARTLIDGVIYEVAIEDYEKLGADKIDAGFTQYIHEEFISHFSGEIEDSNTLETDAGVYGFASCYRYEMNGRKYLADIISFGFQDKMVRFNITAKGQFESAARLTLFVGGFEIL